MVTQLTVLQPTISSPQFYNLQSTVYYPPIPGSTIHPPQPTIHYPPQPYILLYYVYMAACSLQPTIPPESTVHLTPPFTILHSPWPSAVQHPLQVTTHHSPPSATPQPYYCRLLQQAGASRAAPQYRFHLHCQ